MLEDDEKQREKKKKLIDESMMTLLWACYSYGIKIDAEIKIDYVEIAIMYICILIVHRREL